MKRFELTLAALFLLLFTAFWLWQTPGLIRGKLSAAEIDAYLAAIERNLVAPDALKQQALSDLRAWAERDDAKPVFMLNLMRYYAELQSFPGVAEFHGSPAESNAHYEARVMPLALADGDYPIYGGDAEGGNLFGHVPGADNWSRILVMRYPSRRHFLRLLGNPAYGPLLPYKLAALELSLVPTRAELLLPDLRIAFGALLLAIFLATGWRRAARAASRKRVPRMS